MNNLFGEPMGDYGKRAYLENGEIKKDIGYLNDKLDALVRYFGLKFVRDDYGEVYLIKDNNSGGEK